MYTANPYQARAYQKYKEQEITTANPLSLVVMLYNGCIKRLRQAQLAIEKKEFSEANAHLKRAQDIISELVSGLDFHYPIANDLLAIYDFMLRQIIEINITKNKDAIEPVVGLLSGLRDTWAQVSKSVGNTYQEEGLE